MPAASNMVKVSKVRAARMVGMKTETELTKSPNCIF